MSLQWDREGEYTITAGRYTVTRFIVDGAKLFRPFIGSRPLIADARRTAKEAMEICERNYQITGGAED